MSRMSPAVKKNNLQNERYPLHIDIAVCVDILGDVGTKAYYPGGSP